MSSPRPEILATLLEILFDFSPPPEPNYGDAPVTNSNTSITFWIMQVIRIDQPELISG